MFLGVCTALMLTTMNVNLKSWLGFAFRDVGATDEAGRGVDIEKEGTEVSIPPTSKGSEGCLGEMWGPPVCQMG